MKDDIDTESDDFELITANVDIDGHGCWNWLGPLSNQYAWAIRPGGNNMHAYRLSYQVFVGPLIRGMVIDHLCENKLCVNPEHLEQITSSENVKRWHAACRARQIAFAY